MYTCFDGVYDIEAYVGVVYKSIDLPEMIRFSVLKTYVQYL